MLRGIFFDLDDTLIAYSDAVQQAIEQTAQCGQKFYPELTTSRLLEAMTRSYHKTFGSGTPGYKRLATLPTTQLRQQLTELSLVELGVPVEPVLVAYLQECYTQAEAAFLKPFPDTQATLRALKPHYVLGIITNGPGPLQREKLAQLNLTSWFDVIIVDSEYGSPKPDPNLFLHAASQAKLDKSELMFVGNAVDADIEGANGAGWCSVHLNPAPVSAATYTIACLSDLLHIPPVAENLILATRTNLADTI